MTPSISVIIPVHNGATYLAAAIESVLTQSKPAGEIIVVDDGSIDNTPVVAQKYVPKIQIHTQPHSGAAAARNMGVSLASGEWLAFLDADDLWLADKLEKQFGLFEQNQACEMAFGGVEQFNSPDLCISETPAVLSQMTKGYHVGAMLIRRASFLRVGLFSEALRVGEFIDWYARAQEMGIKESVLPQIVMRRRIHENNLMKREKNITPDYAHILKQALLRRRLAKEQV